MTTALFAGSFDPIHLGHLGMVETATKLFDEVWVAAVGNPSKSSGLFTIDERTRLIAESTAHLPTVHAIGHDGLVVDLAATIGADVLVRSVGKERSAEFEMAYLNNRIGGIATVFLLPEQATAHISSRLVRERFEVGDVDGLPDLVPPPVVAAMRELAAQRSGRSSGVSPSR